MVYNFGCWFCQIMTYLLICARLFVVYVTDEAMSGGLAKACGLGKMYSVAENISYFIENQTE